MIANYLLIILPQSRDSLRIEVQATCALPESVEGGLLVEKPNGALGCRLALQWQKRSFKLLGACNFHCVSGQNHVHLLKTLVGVCLVKMRCENDHLPGAHAAEGRGLHWRAWERLAWKSLRGISSGKLKIITLEHEEVKVPAFWERPCCRWRFSRLMFGAVAPSFPVTPG